MSEILQMFSGNPLATVIGKKVEAATRPELESDDWALNLEICDMINENDDDAKDAARAIKKRLQQIELDRNFAVTNRTLTVLETCVSNCSRRFHVLVMSKDFIQDLVKLIGPKNNPPIHLQERVLRLIERWAEAFRSQPDLGGVVAVYNELKSKGVTFPPKDPSSNVPIQTPQRTVAPTQAAVQLPVSPSIRSGPLMSDQQPQAAGPIVLEGEGYNKITQDLGVVQTSVDMFNDIMRHLESDNEDADWKLAADLNTTCRQMKDRIVDLIERVANEDLTIELLRLNDDLNNIFIKYDRLVKNRSKLQTGAGDSIGIVAPPAGGRVPVASRAENELSLIDFDASTEAERSTSAIAMPAQTSATTTTTATTRTPTTSTIIDPFDSSAVNAAISGSDKPTSTSRQQPERQSSVDPLADGLNRLNLGAKKTSGLPEEISSVREQDFAEIENWLSTDSGRDLASIAADLPSLEPISIPNTEFDNFIASRAAAGSSSTAASQQQQPKFDRNQKPEPST